MRYSILKTALPVAAACLASLGHAGPAGHLPLKPGTYVVSSYTPCNDAPLAGVVAFDGKALSGPHESSCTTSILRQQGDSYRVTNVCRALGDGSPSTPSKWVETVRIDSPSDMTVSTAIGRRHIGSARAFTESTNNVPVINVQMLSGRSAAQKKQFIDELAVVAMRTLAVPETAITIVLTEVAPEHWGAGRLSMAERRGAKPRKGDPDGDLRIKQGAARSEESMKTSSRIG